MKRHRYLWILVGLLVFASLACNAFAGEPLEPTLPRPDLPGSGDEDGDDLAELPTAVIQNIAPTATLAGEFPPTATPIVAEPVDGDAVLRALVDVNIRMGPGVAYGRDSFLFGGETAVVLGRHAESGWWKIVCPERADGNVCWVSGGSQYTSVSNAGAAQAVAAPPTPTAAPTVAAIIAPTAVSDLSASSSVAGTTEAAATDLEFGMASAGSHMVFADEGALWLLSLDDSAAEPTWLAEAENIVDMLISPNGRYAAYVLADEYDASLHVADIQSGAVQTVVDAADLAEMTSSPDVAVLIGQMQWLADNEAIAFNTYVVNLIGPGVLGQADLWTVDLAGALTERFPAGEGGGTFVISPDDVVVFGQTTAVVRANLDGSDQETVIDFEFVNTASEFAFYPWLQWTEDGAVAAISSPDPYSAPEAELWRIPVVGEAESLASVDGNIIFSPVIWSDSGLQLGYVREMAGSEAALVVGTGDGADTSNYAENVSRFFGWSPAESHFVYAGQGNYAIGQLSGEPLVVELAEGKTAVSAQWLYDNTLLIALGSSENWDFRLQTIDGPATRLISGSTTPIFDTWTP
jgi:hypothetical protein